MFTALVPTLRLLLKPGPLREVIRAVDSLPAGEVYDTITAIEPVLRHFVQRGRRGAYPELALYFLATIFCVEKHGVIYDAHLSDKFGTYGPMNVSRVCRQRFSFGFCGHSMITTHVAMRCGGRTFRCDLCDPP
jgi:hypothetical protein